MERRYNPLELADVKYEELDKIVKQKQILTSNVYYELVSLRTHKTYGNAWQQLDQIVC